MFCVFIASIILFSYHFKTTPAIYYQGPSLLVADIGIPAVEARCKRALNVLRLNRLKYPVYGLAIKSGGVIYRLAKLQCHLSK